MRKYLQRAAMVGGYAVLLLSVGWSLVQADTLTYQWDHSDPPGPNPTHGFQVQ